MYAEANLTASVCAYHLHRMGPSRGTSRGTSSTCVQYHAALPSRRTSHSTHNQPSSSKLSNQASHNPRQSTSRNSASKEHQSIPSCTKEACGAGPPMPGRCGKSKDAMTKGKAVDTRLQTDGQLYDLATPFAL